MKTVTIIRHAKTEHGTFGMRDLDRNLLPRGIKDAKLIAEFLKENLPALPDAIITSTANRAIQTTDVIADVLGYPQSVIMGDESIYHGGVNELFEICFALDPSVNSAMIVGHNPTVAEFVNVCSRQSVFHFPTACVSVIQFDTDEWQKIGRSLGELVLYQTPKELR